MIIVERCHRSWAAETPGKYERDSKYLTYTSAKNKISRNEEINEESFSNLHIWTTVAYLEKDY